jgi:hypothetical protein
MQKVNYAMRSHPSEKGVMWTAWNASDEARDYHDSLAAGKPSRSGIDLRSAANASEVKTVLRAAVGSKCALVEKKWQINARQNNAKQINAKAFKPSGKRPEFSTQPGQEDVVEFFRPGSRRIQLHERTTQHDEVNKQYGDDLPNSILALCAVAKGYMMATAVESTNHETAQKLNKECLDFLDYFHRTKTEDNDYDEATQNDREVLTKIEKILQLLKETAFDEKTKITHHIVYMQNILSEEGVRDEMVALDDLKSHAAELESEFELDQQNTDASGAKLTDARKDLEEQQTLLDRALATFEDAKSTFDQAMASMDKDRQGFELRNELLKNAEERLKIAEKHAELMQSYAQKRADN